MRRWATHRHELKHKTHANSILQRAWDKYGATAIRFSILEIVSEPILLVAREQYWMDLLNPQFNLQKVAGSRLGMKMSPETRAKISAAGMGRKRSPEAIEKWRATMIAKGGFVCSEQKRAKLTGRKYSLESRKKMSEARKRRVTTTETRSKMSASGYARWKKYHSAIATK